MDQQLKSPALFTQLIIQSYSRQLYFCPGQEHKETLQTEPIFDSLNTSMLKRRRIVIIVLFLCIGIVLASVGLYFILPGFLPHTLEDVPALPLRDSQSSSSLGSHSDLKAGMQQFLKSPSLQGFREVAQRYSKWKYFKLSLAAVIFVALSVIAIIVATTVIFTAAPSDITHPVVVKQPDQELDHKDTDNSISNLIQENPILSGLIISVFLVVLSLIIFAIAYRFKDRIFHPRPLEPPKLENVKWFENSNPRSAKADDRQVIALLKKRIAAIFFESPVVVKTSKKVPTLYLNGEREGSTENLSLPSTYACNLPISNISLLNLYRFKSMKTRPDTADIILVAEPRNGVVRMTHFFDIDNPNLSFYCLNIGKIKYPDEVDKLEQLDNVKLNESIWSALEVLNRFL